MKIGLDILLFCIFLVLKLVGVIDWSWWWVSAPLWAPVALWAFLCAFFFTGVLIKGAKVK
jgi:hypothetical protein